MIRPAKSSDDHRQSSAEALLAAIMGRADCMALTGGEAVLTAVVPVEWLDDAFALMGASEDLEDGDIDQNTGDDEPSLCGLGMTMNGGAAVWCGHLGAQHDLEATEGTGE